MGNANKPAKQINHAISQSFIVASVDFSHAIRNPAHTQIHHEHPEQHLDCPNHQNAKAPQQ
jgi:hypothetical protein